MRWVPNGTPITHLVFVFSTCSDTGTVQSWGRSRFCLLLISSSYRIMFTFNVLEVQTRPTSHVVCRSYTN
jgi:hypothetical protein